MCSGSARRGAAILSAKRAADGIKRMDAALRSWNRRLYAGAKSLLKRAGRASLCGVRRAFDTARTVLKRGSRIVFRAMRHVAGFACAALKQGSRVAFRATRRAVGFACVTLKRAGRAFLHAAAKIGATLRGHAGKAAYYGCVAVVLCAIAYAADQYRSETEPSADALILPAADVGISTAAVEVLPILPEGGELLRGFTDLPEWNGTLQMWEAHGAVDYRLPENEVKNLCEGTVRTVGRSGVYGGFVEVDCGAWRIRYASMDVDQSIVPNQQVALGDVLGRANTSMAGEAALGAHLHLEIERGGKLLNFERCAEKKPSAAD